MRQESIEGLGKKSPPFPPLFWEWLGSGTLALVREMLSRYLVSLPARHAPSEGDPQH